jgi:hypothetical protein
VATTCVTRYSLPLLEEDVEGRMSDQPVFACCFCGSSIIQDRHDPVTLTISLNGESASGAAQELRCHGSCLKERLRPGVATLMEAYGAP